MSYGYLNERLVETLPGVDGGPSISSLSGPSGPANVLVAGAAGFIGSHLVDRLLADGLNVTGVDNLDPWYDPERKRSNLAAATANPRFRFVQVDLVRTSHSQLVQLLRSIDVVYHLAGRAGVQDSWGDGFRNGCDQNVLATQRLLEAACDAEVGRVVLASSSSVYGDRSEASAPGPISPISPYGASKAAAELLAGVYGHRGLPTVILRYFTVFGPRQRPDMAFNRLFEACRGGAPFLKRGDGEQRREFTFVGDVVAATTAAGAAPLDAVAGRTFDVGGGCVTSLNEVIDCIESLVGRRPDILATTGAPGDPALTQADLGPTVAALGWRPRTELRAGLTRQWGWHQRESASSADLAALRAPAGCDRVPLGSWPADLAAS